MTTEVLYAPNIDCRDCTATVERELAALAGVRHVSADLVTKRVTISYDEPASEEHILARLEQLGYPVG